jgi:SAM-dependent methyltransferase
MAQNIYDDPGFFEGYARMRRSLGGLEAAPEWPTLRAMVGDVAGKRVLDLGCGMGWFCRWAAEAGAAAVLGLDLSEKMLARAREVGGPDVIRYERADLDTLELPAGGFDVAHSSLAFHYVADAGRLYRTIHDALAPGGRLAFSTEHPIYMAPAKPGWVEAEDGRKLWPLDGYLVEGPRVTDWLAPGVIKHHRTLATTLNHLIAAGFTLERVEEFRPTPEDIAARPELRDEVERPMFLIVQARRA